MIKIAISGQANSGKDTLCSILDNCFWDYKLTDTYCLQKMSFALPIKRMALQMFPNLPEEWLFGDSKLRDQVIPNALKDGEPLTIRRLLLDIGTQGRLYNENIWVDNFAHRFEEVCGQRCFKAVIVSDVRFSNEFNYLRSKSFFQIRLYRTSNKPIINHESELKQQEIKDSEFNYVLYNNQSLTELKQEVVDRILPLLKDRG